MTKFSNSKNRTVLIPLIWLLLIFFLAIKLIFEPPVVKTNLTDLFASQTTNKLTTSFTSNILTQNNAKLMFLIEGSTRDEVIEVGQELKFEIESQTHSQVKFLDGLELLETKLQDNKDQIYALLDQKDLDKLNGLEPVRKIERHILHLLNSPLSGYYAQFLDYDPLLLTPNIFLKSRAGINGEYTNEGLFNRYDGKECLTVFASLESGISGQEQEMLKKLEDAVSQIKFNHPQLKIVWTGFSKFAVTSKNKIETEIKWFSNISVFLVSSLIIFCFRSIKPLILTSLTVVVGLAVGLFFVGLTQNSIHLMTIGFGSCLVGACVDYSLHYLVHVKGQNCNNVKFQKDLIKTISLGALTTILSFTSLYFTDFPGLKELSLFAIGALVGTYGTVVFVFPFLPASFLPQSKNLNKVSLKLNFLTERFFTSKVPRALMFVTAGAILLGGLLRLEFNDDIRLLQQNEPNLIKEIKWINDRNGITIPSAYLLIDDRLTSKQRFDLENLLFKLKTQGKITGFINTDPLLKSKTEKVESISTVKNFYSIHSVELLSMLENIGIESFKVSGLARILESISLPEHEQVIPSIAIYGSGKDLDLISLLRTEGLGETIFYYDQVSEISSMFKAYRILSIWHISLAYIIIFITLGLVYGFKSSARACASSLIGAFMSLATMGLLGLPVNFFSILSTVIVLGLGIDFALFLKDSKEKDYSSQTSVFLSVISAFITFGLFSFSSTNILQSISAIISLGVVYTYCAANILVLQRTK